jgi:hypothetical protein
MRRSGLCSVALLLAAGCVYGFAGGGLPAHVRTIAVIPFENETTSTEIQRELVDALRTELRDRLGVRDAPESRANAIVRGTIQRYEVDIPVAYSADNRATTTALRMLQIVVDLELVDQVTGETLWERKGFVADGKYEERGEPAARREAIGRVVNALVEGAQSQW